MLIGTVLLGAALALSPPTAVGPKTDVLYMKNGDRLTCEIKTLDAGALHVSLDYVDGTIAVGWGSIARLESTKLFIVQLSDGSVYSGTLKVVPSDVPDSVRIQIEESSGNTVLIDKGQIAGLGGTSDKFWGRFNGTIASGVSYTKGNNSTTYSFSSTIAYPRPRWSASLTLNSNLNASEGASTSTRNQLDLNAAHLLRWSHWFYTGWGGFLQSAEQGISLQTSLGGGVGRFLENTSDVKASLGGGLVWQATRYESSVNGAPTEDVLGLAVIGRLNYVRFKTTTINLTANGIPALNELGRFFFNTNASVYFQLFGDVDWNVSFYGNWDTRPPSGSSGSDYGVNSGLSWTFGDW